MKHRHKKEHEHDHNPFAQEKEKKQEDIKTEEQEESVQQDNLSTIQQDYDNLNNQYIRLAADFDNYRKRQAQERESLLKYGAEESLKKFMEVLDNFDRAKASIDNSEDIQQIKESFNVLYNQMFDNLAKLGMEAINAQGREFDPNFHEAVMSTPTKEYPENYVIMELQKGYKFEDKVLRPSLVNVAIGE